MTAEVVPFTIEDFSAAALRKLVEWGVTPDELVAMRLHPHSGERFEDWSFDLPLRYDATIRSADAADRTHLMKLFCTVKWLMSKPPWTRDRDDAYEALERFLLQPDFVAGRRYRMNQRSRAKKPRGKLAKDGTTMRDVVRKLLQDHPGESARMLWYHLKSELEDEQLAPIETVSGKGGSMRQFTYDSFSGDNPRTITEGRFATLISEVRREPRLPGSREGAWHEPLRDGEPRRRNEGESNEPGRRRPRTSQAAPA